MVKEIEDLQNERSPI